MFNAVLALILGYLVGSFPSAYLIARLKKRDIFTVGSGNMGAMNTARNLGMGLGVIVLLLDITKGALASYLGLLLTPAPADSLLPAFSAGLGAVLGHAWSLYLGFRGGKALATAFGVALPLYPLTALTSLIVLVLLIALFKRVALSSVLVTFIHTILAGVLPYRFPLPGWHYSAAVATLTLIIIYKHLPAVWQELRLKDTQT
jgi:acyl phosphate:glycerol-3-phosphate acyltransferase